MDGPAMTRVIGIGELLWDVFPDGPRLGGAPFNAIADLRRLGHPAAFVTAIGDDELGRAALAAAVELGIDPSLIDVAPDLPTGIVAVRPDPVAGHRFEIGSPAAYEAIGRDDGTVARIAAWQPDAVVFGTLAQRSAAARAVLERIEAATRLYDVNLRDGCWTRELVAMLLPLATIVKVNDSEASEIARIVGCRDDPVALGARLAADHGIRLTCVTRGSEGAVLWADGELIGVDAIPVTVVDSVGAGDAFAAGLLHGVLTGLRPAESLALANRLGAVVASRPGALPDWRLHEIASQDRGAAPG